MAQYVITDGKDFIYRNFKNQFVAARGEAMADIYSKKQAELIFNNSLPKIYRKSFHIEKIDEPPKNVKQITKEDIQENSQKVMTDENIKKWLDRISNLNGLADDATKRKETLRKDLSNIDKEITDSHHYIEFANFNAAEGYSAASRLKAQLKRRRAIKNELEVLSIILDKKISDAITDEVMKKVEKMDNREYKPRILNELFDL